MFDAVDISSCSQCCDSYMMALWDDRISELPECLRTQILSYLPTKDSAKTSVLASKWKNLWLHVPGFDLNCKDFRFVNDDKVFFSVIDRFLQFNPESCLEKFKVNYSRRNIYSSFQGLDRFKGRIGSVVNRGVQHLDLKGNVNYRDRPGGFIYYCIDFMPLNLYTSKTLVSLKLSSSGLEDPGFVYMPCLKSMHLVKIQWHGTMNLEKLVSGCPLLEELTLLRDIDDEVAVMRLRSRSLKRFCVPFEYNISCKSNLEYTLEIDAPGLEYMSVKEDHFDRYVVKNHLTSLSMIDLDIKFVVKFGMFLDPEDLSKTNEIRDFLIGISSVRHLIISNRTVKALLLYSKVGPIPEFYNLSRLQAVYPSALLPFLPALLESFPNLKHLTLKFVYPKVVDLFELTDVPWCFLSTLECVEMKGTSEWEKSEMKLASYFLEKSAVLKKLILSLTVYHRDVPDSDIYEELNHLTKRSPTCQIIVGCSHE